MLVDSSVWVDLFRTGNTRLRLALSSSAVWCHDFVLGELSCGNMPSRSATLALLARLPRATVAMQDEVERLVDRERLWGRGLGWVDVHLLASARLSALPLWTLDKRLAAAGAGAGVTIV